MTSRFDGSHWQQRAGEKLLKFATAMNKETDCGVALICAAHLDDILGQMIVKRLVESSVSKALVLGGKAALSGFSARIDTAFALGLISAEERDGCNVIRKIRNKFAHSIEVDFACRSIIDLCANLTQTFEKPPSPPRNEGQARALFEMFTFNMIASLEHRTSLIAGRRLSHEDWDE